MDASPKKNKPIPPPKPASRLSGQHESQNKRSERSSDGTASLAGDHIYSEISEKIENKDVLLKKTPEERRNANSVSIGSPKPPLLPKPSLQLRDQASRPTLQISLERRQNEGTSFQVTSLLTQKSINSKRNTGLAPLSLRAPVATFEEGFESYEKESIVSSPVRPPRSPKSKPLVGGPFEQSDIRPALPVKMRSVLPSREDNKNWENTKIRSMSLGRSVNIDSLPVESKSQSLGRNLSLHEQLASCTVTKIGPVPPPRRRNRSEVITKFSTLLNAIVDLKEIPVYAEVNYEMKKNRRGKITQTDVSSLQLEIGADDVFQNDVVEGKLVLGSTGTTEAIPNSSVGSVVSNDTSVNISAETPGNQTKAVSNVLDRPTVSEGLCDEAVKEMFLDDEKSSKSEHLKENDTENPNNIPVPVSSNLYPSSQTNNNVADSNDQTGNSSELFRIMSDPGLSSEIQSAFKTSDGAIEEKESCDNVNNELTLKNVQMTATITDNRSPNISTLYKGSESLDCAKCDIDEVLNISDLVIVEKAVCEDVATPLWRNSWTPSPERVTTRKQHSWCDEGDLSNGVLADSDTGSSLSQDDGNPVRSKSWFSFGSIGKGSRKRNKDRKTRSSSQFYSEDENLQPNVANSPSASVGSEPVQNQPLSNTGIKCEEDSESENEDPQGNVIDSQVERQRQERKVFYIAQELMTSEKEFVDVLKLLNVQFSQAINARGTESNPVIPKSEFAKIINSLPQLQRLNEDLLQDLEHRIENWSSLQKIADVIVKKGPFLKLYSSYIQNFESQCNLLDECCQKYPRFAKAVKEFEASPCCKKLNIKHFMLKPVQRIPQYRLLLEDYLQHLDGTSPDYNDTEEALRIVRDVADHANRSVKLGDHLSKLIELQAQLSNYEIIKPGRQFVKDGELFKLSRKGRHPRFFILLSDCLLYTSKSNTTLIRVNNELPLNGMKVSLPQVEDYRCEFSIISITRSFTLAASSVQERADWITALENAIKDHAERQQTLQIESKTRVTFKLGQQAPVWIQDSRVTMCQSCTAQFTAFFRRHHCRACGKVVCGVCSDNKAPLQYMRFHAARVCEECHDVLLQEFEDPSANMIEIIMKETGQVDIKETEESMRSLFRKSAAVGKKHMLQKKDIPQRLKEVAANDGGSQMSGWLQRRGRRSWKRLWFVLKEQVLYVYKASEDVVALESIPVLGYKVEPMVERHFQIYEGIDARLVFQLAHSGQLPLVFHADTEHMANKWMQAMQEATVLT